MIGVADPRKQVSAPSLSEILEVDRGGFDGLAARVLAFQRRENAVYGRFSAHSEFLPVAAFKHGPVCTFQPSVAEAVFRSSGTGGGACAVHHVRHLAHYESVVSRGFERVVGNGPFTILAHLPHYAADSSLVHMARTLVQRFGTPGSGLFLDDTHLLEQVCSAPGAPLVLLGAAFGLLDQAETGRWRLPAGSIVIETGGMKTHRREITRARLRSALAEGFGVSPDLVWSEYGMCEMMSQCYAKEEGLFESPPWVQASVRNPERPSETLADGQPGVLAILDLANVHSASALLTEDRAVMQGDRFEILGRLTGAELRGCNFLLEEE